jgi:predicted phage terminase large subunit-like protein
MTTLIDQFAEERAKLLGSLLLFTQVFYKIRTGRDFVISEPVGRESHHITISRQLTRSLKLEVKRLLINIQPGAGKSEMMINFIAWCFANYPDSQFLYLSYSHELAAKHTYTVRQIIELPHYKKLFGVEIKSDSSAKDDFKTIQGGALKAFGSHGAVTGQDAGLPNLDRFSGAIIMDDMHKPDEAHSDTIRENVKRNYLETIVPRPRSPNVPVIFIGQRLHEDDLPQNLINEIDGKAWVEVILKSLDDAGNALHPAVTPKDELLNLQEKSPYVFASQYQQDPLPSGGGIFKPEWFVLYDEEPQILSTFITVDSAETAKDYNDATVFSFWGIYNIVQNNVDIGLLGLHCINCVELRCEPKDLQGEFDSFYASCMRHRVKPMIAGIEKKSTGVTLCSVLSDKIGLRIIEIERTKASGNKTSRYLEIQPYIASRRISLTEGAKHTDMVITHMQKITANDTHRHDDIADTFYDAVKMGLIDEIVLHGTLEKQIKLTNVIKKINQSTHNLYKLKRASYANS